MIEDILDPDLPIIDAHHHLWDLRGMLAAMPPSTHSFSRTVEVSPLYLFDNLLADTGAGHNIVATVYMECGAFYRADASPAMKPVGEIEFVNGVAAQSASGLYGKLRACAAIVGHADLNLGRAAGEVLDAEIAAGNGRFRGIRHIAAHDSDSAVLGPLVRAPEGMMAQETFRAGFAELSKRGLTFDAWVLEPQINEVTELARAFPDASIILDHVGTPLGIGRYQGQRDARFAAWKASIRALADCPNVAVKLGGLGMPYCGWAEQDPANPPSSEALAALWKPYIETCIEAFGADRSMFESNFPVDRWGGDYVTLWNTFKRLAADASSDEKTALFSGTAARVYGMTLSD